MTESIVPTRSDERIDTLDVLRGIAICGILLMNIPAMGMIGDLGLPAFPAQWNLDWIAVSVQRLLFSGTMRGLFTMLFGAGMLLMLRRTFTDAAQITPIDVWARRCLALMGLGVVQWLVFMWPGEILWNYGLCGLMLLAFRTARPRALLVAAAICLLSLCALLAWQKSISLRALETAAPVAAARAAGKPLTAEQLKTVAPIDKASEALHPKPTTIAEERTGRTHLSGLIAWSWIIWRDYNLGTDSWNWVLESLAFMLVGMALFRTGVLTGAAPSRVYIRFMLIGYPIGLAVRAVTLSYNFESSYDLDIPRIVGTQSILLTFVFEIARLLVTLGHVGLIVMLFRKGAIGKAWPIRALGRMALTVYSLQSILTSILFYGFGFVGAFGFAVLMGISVLIWIVTAIFCVAWLRKYEIGPAEQFLRAVAYMTFRRHRPEAAATLAAGPAL